MKRVFLTCSIFVLSGCAGLADYSVELNDGYEIVRSSAHQIQIVGDEPVSTTDNTTYNYFYVPAKVVAVYEDEHIIAAKQLKLQADERGYEKEPEKITSADYAYWIIDKMTHTVDGPLTLQKLEEKLNMSIEFVSVEKLKKASEK